MGEGKQASDFSLSSRDRTRSSTSTADCFCLRCLEDQNELTYQVLDKVNRLRINTLLYIKRISKYLFKRSLLYC